MSSSVYRALRSAGYPDSGIIDFATSLLSELVDGKDEDPELHPPLDAETGFATGKTFAEILEFEFRKAQSARHPLLGMIVVTPQPRELCTAAERLADENLIVDTLRSRMRELDAAGRTHSHEFVLLLPQAGERAVAAAAEDIERALRSAPLSRGSRPQVRHASLAATTGTAGELLDTARSSRLIGEPSVDPRGSANELLERPLVLALCGGAAMAVAHVGVISALEDHGARISGIGATSAGALVAAMYAAGMDRDEIVRRFVSFGTSGVYMRMRSAYAEARVRSRKDRRGMSRARIGFASANEVAVSTERELRALVEHFVPVDRPIESMPIRLAFCATDLVGGCATHISHGSLHDALMAVCAVPGLFPPQKLGEKLLVDGSLAGELPVAAAHSVASGANVIGCYLDRPSSTPKAFESGIAVAERIAAIRERELVCQQTRACEAVLRIPVSDIGWMGFSRCAEAERAGRETALREICEPIAAANGTKSVAALEPRNFSS